MDICGQTETNNTHTNYEWLRAAETSLFSQPPPPLTSCFYFPLLCCLLNPLYRAPAVLFTYILSVRAPFSSCTLIRQSDSSPALCVSSTRTGAVRWIGFLQKMPATHTHVLSPLLCLSTRLLCRRLLKYVFVSLYFAEQKLFSSLLISPSSSVKQPVPEAWLF